MGVNPVELAGGIRRLPLVEAALSARFRPDDVLRAVERRDAVWQPVYAATESGDQAVVGRELARVLGRHGAGIDVADADLARVWGAVPDALAGTDPRLQVNRRFEPLMQHLVDDLPILTDTAGGGRTAEWITARIKQETRLGYHGEGDDAGRSVYVSLQFGDEVSSMPYDELLTARVPTPGAWSFGAFSMQIGPHVAGLTTVGRADSPLLVAADELGGVEQLRSVVMERIVRDTRLMHNVALVDESTMTQTLHAYMRSHAFSGLEITDNSFFEGQVRGGMRASDLRRITVDSHPWGTAATREEVRAVRDAARPLGIPVAHDTRVYERNFIRNPQAERWWEHFEGGALRATP